jgi:hypothetical protein
VGAAMTMSLTSDAASERRAMHARDHRLGTRGVHVHHVRKAARIGQVFLCAVDAAPFHPAQVGARTKRRPSPASTMTRVASRLTSRSNTRDSSRIIVSSKAFMTSGRQRHAGNAASVGVDGQRMVSGSDQNGSLAGREFRPRGAAYQSGASQKRQYSGKP